MRVAVITTSRADWNALQPVARELHAQGAELRICAIHDHAGMNVVEQDAAGVGLMVKIGGDLNVQRAVDFLETLVRWNFGEGWRPDIVVVCGDRHETLLAAFAAAFAGIPIAHIAGGDVTQGSSDDKYRDAISMLADMHFPTHEAAAGRLEIMGAGICQQTIFAYGSPAVDRLMRTPIMPRAELCKALGLEDPRPFILANWQPETPRDGSGLAEMLKALAYQSLPGVFVGVNPDPGADSAEQRILEFTAVKPGWRRHANLAPELYLNAMFHAHCLIGNSSSGFYEAPYYGTPVINVGGRQMGRPVPECMVQVDANTADIGSELKDLERGVRYSPQQFYGDGTAAPRIARAILTPLVR